MLVALFRLYVTLTGQAYESERLTHYRAEQLCVSFAGDIDACRAPLPPDADDPESVYLECLAY